MTKCKKKIVLLPGDGIGPEVTLSAARLLEDCAAEFGHEFDLIETLVGGVAIDRCGSALPTETVQACRDADAILLGAVGGPRWDAAPLGRRPESGLLALRKELELYVNVRPIFLRPGLRGISPLRANRNLTIDLEIVRELAGGIYFGTHGAETDNGVERAFDVESYSTPEIERVARFAFKRAASRRAALASVDKANVLASSELWRRTVTRLATEYQRVRLGHLYVDNAAMQLILAPEHFDVILTSNMFGDILSDAAAALVGSIGLIPSMSCGSETPLFEPIHGSAPSLAGKDIACPIAAILCISMMLREAFGLLAEAEWIERALDRVLACGIRTQDIAEPSSTVVGCSRFVNMVRAEMKDLLETQESYGWAV